MLGGDRRWFFKRDLTVCCRHYPVRYRGHPFSQEGEYPRATFCERKRKVLRQNSPFLEGVDFFCLGKKKTKVVLGDDRRCFFEPHLFRVLLPTLPRRASPATPSARRGIVHRELLADTTPSAIAATPFRKKGNIRELLFVREMQKHWGKIPLF